jgi:hypothetical protein
MTTTIDQGVHLLGAWPSTRRLRTGLRANAVFSLACGVGLLAGGWWLATPWRLGAAWLPALVGAGVAAFGVALARIAVEPAERLRRLAAAVVGADLAWVVASAVLLLRGDRPAGGVLAVAGVAGAVLGFAAWQVAGIAAIRRGDPLADVEIVEASTVLAAPPDEVWPLVTDHDLYGHLAPNLSRVEVISAPGAPLRRRCTSKGGDSWGETCTLWDEGRRFAVEVDTSDYPYPLGRMYGRWQVDPHRDGSIVTMRFAYQARRTIRGGLFTIAFRPLFRPALAAIFRGWRRRLRTDDSAASAGSD